jgi:hypothetical protein
MGTLRKLSDDEQEHTLPSRCLVGRSPAAWVRLSHPCASHEHAAIEWSGGHWRVRDLGSKNGTTVNGRACSTEWHELVAGDRLAFGGDDERWLLTERLEPPPAAIGPEGRLRLGGHGFLALPDEAAPAAAVYAEGDGWRLDSDDKVTHVENGSHVHVGGEAWELLLPSAAGQSTLDLPSAVPLRSLEATFSFDRSEEHVRVTLRNDDVTIALPDRSFHYLLLVLARARVHDRMVRGLSEEEAGWLDSAELARQLRVRPAKLNVDIFRARQLLAHHDVAGAAGLIERRPHSQQLRIGLERIQLLPL